MSDPRLREAALQQLILRRLALARLVDLKEAVSELELEAAIQARRQFHEQRERSFEETLRREGTVVESVKADLAWSMSWPAYRDRALDDAALTAYYQAHRRKFDGTSRRTSQILVRPDRTTAENQNRPWSEADLALAVKRAESLRQEISEGRTTFADVARRESEAPSRAKGGDIGFVPFRGVVHARLAEAIFEVSLGQVSRPVVTPHGVHLVTVSEERAGKRSLADVRQQVERAAELGAISIAGGRAASQIGRPAGRSAVTDTCQSPRREFGPIPGSLGNLARLQALWFTELQRIAGIRDEQLPNHFVGELLLPQPSKAVDQAATGFEEPAVGGQSVGERTGKVRLTQGAEAQLIGKAEVSAGQFDICVGTECQFAEHFVGLDELTTIGDQPT